MVSASSRKTIFNKISARILYPLADNIIAVSSGIRSSILENKLANPSRVIVIYNPIVKRPDTWDGVPKATERTIVSCGRLEPQKDYPTLLRAFRLVRKTHNIKLIILGEGSLRYELEAAARDLGLSEDVEFVGFASNPLQYMRDAEVFVHTAVYEGFGLVLLEALTVGCPVVATDCPGGVREVLADGEFGTLVPVGNDKAIAEAVTKILDGERSFFYPTEHLKQFNIERIADSYLEVLFPAAK
jgi:glycosyltransferase involved in cell wall biosynthesis